MPYSPQNYSAYSVAAATASIVDIIAPNNATLQDSFQFGQSTDTWTLAANWKMDIKAANTDVAPLLELSTTAGTIVVLDTVNRVIQLKVPYVTIQTLPAGVYVYDLIMYDGSSPPIRTLLMQGKFIVTLGVTES